MRTRREIHAINTFLASENIRICTFAEEKDNLEVEQQLFNPLVMELARDEKLLETNKMMLLQYAMRKSADKDPKDWNNLEA
ncbi:UMP-CMP kinase [Hordeum vulgare]|nr:UMP-CMP kinase [Hordeum vulgare]